MSVFGDHLLLQLRSPTELINLIDPPADAAHARLKALIAAVYDLPYATLHSVRDVQLAAAEFQRPIFLTGRIQGTWTQIHPAYTRADLLLNTEKPADLLWIDVDALVQMNLVLELDEGKIESITTRPVERFTTLAEFRNHFRFIDMDAFMARHGFTTVEELKDAYQYIIAEVKLKALGVFDPNDPQNFYRYPLRVAILARDTLDLTASLREAKLARKQLERALAYQQETAEAEVISPYALLMVFPASSLPGAPLTETAVRQYFSAEGVTTLFVTPP